MHRFLVFIVVVGVVVFAGYQLIVKRQTNFPNLVRPTTTNTNSSSSSSTTPENSTNLNIPEGFSMKIFADLEGAGARVLATDNNGLLLLSIPEQGRVVALPDRDGDYEADETVTVLEDLNNPHGIVVNGGNLYVAETDSVSRYNYNPDELTASSRQELFSLPGGGRHFSRTIKINGDKLYTSIGSSCDVCDEDHEYRSTILISNLDGSDLRVFAKGLRNTVFFDFDSRGRIWGNDMGRDFLGDNLPPDELNVIEDGKDYGWPYCYGKNVRDTRYEPGEGTNYCESTAPSKYDYPAHVAPLGITFDSEGNIISSFHGSWNSTEPVGYKVVKLTRSGDEVTKMEDYITGFIQGEDVAARPVDVLYDESNNLFISDDYVGAVYILYR